jgi:hypothetical protein
MKWLLRGLTAALVLVTIVTALIGIWTVGPNSGRWAGTCMLAFLLTIPTSTLLLFWEEAHPERVQDEARR